MLQPKRVTYRNIHRGRRKGISSSGNFVSFGDFGLKATTSAWISARQIEAARRVMTRYARSGGKMWIRVFPDKSVTARAAETRMGKGKGAVEYWVAVVKPGRVIFEIAGLPIEVAKEALTLASAKLPIRTKIVFRQETSS
jgi:large subunit ribosomal protein L16